MFRSKPISINPENESIEQRLQKVEQKYQQLEEQRLQKLEKKCQQLEEIVAKTNNQLMRLIRGLTESERKRQQCEKMERDVLSLLL
jgi:septal ring factor EnvC (AmiA/AmiB activator)